MFGTTFKTLHIFPLYKLFGYKFPLNYVHVILESPSMWCDVFVLFFSFLFLFSSRTTWPWIFHIYRWRDNNVNMFGMWWKQTPPLPEAWSPVPWQTADPLNCLWFVFFYNPSGFFKRVGVEFFKKQLPMLDDVNEGCMKRRCKKQTQGELMLHEVFDSPQFFDDTANQTHKVAWKVLILPGSK